MRVWRNLPGPAWSRAAIAAAIVVVLGLRVGEEAGTAKGGSRLNVDYEPPRFSVEAWDVGVAEVLREIGMKIGFTVVEAGLSPSLLRFSIKDAPLEEVLRQILRSENHVLLYRDEENSGSVVRRAVDKVVLLGPGMSTSRIADSSGPPRAQDDGGKMVGLLPTPFPRVGAILPPASADGSNFTASDLLTSHARSGIPEVETSRPSGNAQQTAGAAKAMPRRASEPAPSPGEALAITTHMAQRNLAALVEGLNVATASLLKSLPGRR